MTDIPIDPRNAAQAAFWRGPATRLWADRHELFDRLLGGVLPPLLDIAAPQAGERVLDIGCGAGTTVLELARRVGPGGRVVGADISERSVATVRARIAAAGLGNAEVIHADVSVHPFAEGGFDLVFSRFGVMFFADPTAAFTNVRRAMKPGGRLALAAFRTPAENPFVLAPLAAVQHLVPPVEPSRPGEPGMFAWADADRVRRWLAGAGFRDVSLTPVDVAMRFAGPGGAADATEMAMLTGILSRALGDASAAQKDAVRAALLGFFAGHDGPDGIALPGAIWAVQGVA